MRVRLLFVVSLVVGTLLSACDDVGGGGGNVTPGGFWLSASSDGDAVFALVTETGRFHLYTASNQGTGVLSVSNGNDVSANFQLVTSLFRFPFKDGTTQADCTLSGKLKKRATMSVIVDCTTTAGLQFQLAAIPFQYIHIYEFSSSLATIAGLYQTGGPVMDIAADGTIFAQEAFTNCVMNGQVNIIDPAFNLYDFQISYSNCTGRDADQNGATFVGIGFLLEITNPSPPDSSILLLVNFIGEIDGVLVPLYISGFQL